MNSRRLIIRLEAEDNGRVIAQTSTLEGADLPQCPLWVKSRHSHRKTSCLLCLRKRTCALQEPMSVMGQKRTSHGYSSVHRQKMQKAPPVARRARMASIGMTCR
jgi:hypothetical protein